ncbi:diguanylate cyclase domain-containing protein [Magnetospirillum fulvum]|uniref:Diguanylate cyclase with PAS/PAC sensor n=1 Tax=Magnetospirillum fulvum TaxID=1082 RepID=A0A1H6I3T4_MAGFU|nr:diguanylate cyclase [Magnetospirillum fulvum]SEH43233.1 diguanylate cyclase with PAS/PAC sensor [Magnetospirillum fulvum]
MAELGERFTRDLTIRYVAVLAVLGVLSLLSFVGLARSIASAEDGLAQVSLSGNQRMLIERTAFAANRLAVASGPERAASLEMLTDSLERLESRIPALTEAALALPLLPGRDIADGPARQISVDLARFLDLGHRLVAHAQGLDHDDPDLAALSAAAAGPLLEALDDLNLRFREASEDRMRELMVLQGAALLVAMGVLLVSAFGVFHPMVERLRADFTERMNVENELRDSEERLRRILEESPIGVSVSRRRDGRIVFANTRFAEILGVSREQFIGAPARENYVDETQRRAVLAELRRHGQIDGAEVEFRRKDGRPFWSLLTIRSTDFEREPVNLAWIYDITERKAAEQQIFLAAKVLDTLNEAVMITDAANKIIFVNPAFSAITEYSRTEAVGNTPALLSSGRHDGAFYEAMWSELLSKGSWSGDIWNRRKSGEVFPVGLSIVVIRESNGLVSHYVAVFSDITHRKEDEARVWRQANYDALTGLPNRSLFLDRLSQGVQQARRDGKSFAVMFLDLDGFKAVNDRLGHAAGDLLLQRASERLSDCMRGSDTLARLAGDEFVLILHGIRGREEPALVARKLIDQLSLPYDLDGSVAEVRGSVGIALYPDDAEDEAGLIARADQAMYAVKRRGKNGFLFASDLVPATSAEVT